MDPSMDQSMVEQLTQKPINECTETLLRISRTIDGYYLEIGSLRCRPLTYDEFIKYNGKFQFIKAYRAVNATFSKTKNQLNALKLLAISTERICYNGTQILDSLPVDVINQIILHLHPRQLIQVFRVIPWKYTQFYNIILNHSLPLWIRIKPYKRAAKWNSVLHYFINYSNLYFSRPSPNVTNHVNRIIKSILDHCNPKLLRPNYRLFDWSTRCFINVEHCESSTMMYQPIDTIFTIIQHKNIALLELCLNHTTFKKTIDKEIFDNSYYYYAFERDKIKCGCYLPYALESGDIEIVKAVLPYHCKSNSEAMNISKWHLRLAMVNEQILIGMKEYLDPYYLIGYYFCLYSGKHYNNNALTPYGLTRCLEIFNINDNKKIQKLIITIYREMISQSYHSRFRNHIPYPELFDVLFSKVGPVARPSKIPMLPRRMVHMLVRCDLYSGNGTAKIRLEDGYHRISYINDTIRMEDLEMFRIFLAKPAIDLSDVVEYYIAILKPQASAKSISSELAQIGFELLADSRIRKSIKPSQTMAIKRMLQSKDPIKDA